MKIGIDLLPLQSPGSRLRGVGRYGRELVSTLLSGRDGNQYTLYAYDEFTREHLPDWDDTHVLATDSSRGETSLAQVVDRLARDNPHELDLLLILSPFELCAGYDPPPRPRNGLKVAAVVYDFIPFLDQEHYLAEPGCADWFCRRLRTIARYDHLLAISDATRDDAIRLLSLDPSRVVNISGASDGRFFVPDRAFPMSSKIRRTLAKFGILRPFVLSVAGSDERKNVRGLIEAFAQLPLDLRSTYQLVITCYLKSEDADRFRRIGDDHGLGEALILTGEVTDAELRTLYQRCSAFAFPSLYEGLGLPLLEAMHCGAPVLAGRNSSQVEVVGDSGLLVNAAEPASVSAGLASLLAQPDLAAELAARGRARAATFTWERTAARLLEAISQEARPLASTRRHAPHASRPRLAIVSPWRPKKSGISNYAARLVAELSNDYRIELFHDSGYVPDAGLGPAGLACFDYRLFERYALHRDYRAVLYQMGNSTYHGFLYEMMSRHPGIVTLHDFSLAGFQYWRASLTANAEETFRREVEYAEPMRSGEILASLPGWREEAGGVQDALTRRGIPLNRRVLDSAECLVVHSPWCVDRCVEVDPTIGPKLRVIPHGARPVPPSREDQPSAKARLGLDPNGLVFGSFGFLARGKMNVESLRAFAEILREFPDARYLFAGQDWERGEARAEAASLGVEGRVRFIGHCDDSEFEALIQAVDVGVALRRPPTYGETSGALLDLLRHGVATIVSDVGTFADYPSDVVLKITTHEELVRAMSELARNPVARAALGQTARDYVAARHAWPVVASHYARLIEENWANRGRRAQTSGESRDPDFSEVAR